ncbi:MAG: ATP synthase F1 subunit epsilon [Phycisphaerae bacterium]
MAGTTLRCELITPERRVLDTEATAVVFPAHDGEVGILKHRAPLLYNMGVGICRISTLEGERRYYVDGGFARMLGDTLTLLTQDALLAEDIDADAAEEMLAQARQRSARDPQAQEDRSNAIARASAQLKLARNR